MTRIYNTSGTAVFSAQYDPWGVQTVTTNTIKYNRGYCGHEMLNDFQLINMNGRMYDPYLGRFLSPDNYVQLPTSAQSFNRYSYCLNNPLMYVDPSGELWGVFTIINAIGNTITNIIKHGLNVSQYSYKQTKNAWDIERSVFKGSFLQVIGKLTWSILDTYKGDEIANLLNLLGYVKGVSFMDGATAIRTSFMSKGEAFTIGGYLIGDENFYADFNNYTFVHEYGHFMQSQIMGPLYWGLVAIPSFTATVLKFGPSADYRWFEISANKLATKHFDKKYGEESDNYKEGKIEKFFDKRIFETGYDHSSGNIRLDKGVHPTKGIKYSFYDLLGFLFWI